MLRKVPFLVSIKVHFKKSINFTFNISLNCIFNISLHLLLYTFIYTYFEKTGTLNKNIKPCSDI